MGSLSKYCRWDGIPTFVLLALALLFLKPAASEGTNAQQTKCPENVPVTADLKTLRACVPELIKARNELRNALTQINSFAERISALEDTLPHKTFPEGAVVAFDRMGGCPTELGWVEFKRGSGRFIVGVNGKEFKLIYEGKKPIYSIGGKSAIKLTEDHLPNHQHISYHREVPAGHSHESRVGVENISRTMNWLSGPINREGVGIARWSETLNEWKTHPNTVDVPDHLWHQNVEPEEITSLPPYISLIYCKNEH